MLDTDELIDLLQSKTQQTVDQRQEDGTDAYQVCIPWQVCTSTVLEVPVTLPLPGSTLQLSKSKSQICPCLSCCLVVNASNAFLPNSIVPFLNCHPEARQQALYVSGSLTLSRRVQLFSFLLMLQSDRLTVGLTGYPNVGKSSTINALFGSKKTAVAPTPGKTKHFQTLNITDKLTLCDCPGLVLPRYAASKSEMVAAGISLLSSIGCPNSLCI